jgi:alkylation response protein AidB-like acyl-CoA dehydrogenase
MANTHEINGGKGMTRVEIAQRAYDRAVAVMNEKKRILDKAIEQAEANKAKSKDKTSARLAKALALVEEAKAKGLLPADDSDLGTDANQVAAKTKSKSTKTKSKS